MIAAKVILDSVSRQEHRPTSFELVYPKFIHGEFMTHRVFSRNASSSRAIPTEKLLEEVRTDALRAGPVFWGKNQKGMQAVEEFVGGDLDLVQYLWRKAALRAVDAAEAMMKAGAHKQIVNRILEPYCHINVVCTATEFDNFFGLRLHKDAQPEAQALARAMWEARKASTPRRLGPHEWHLPYIDEEAHMAILAYSGVGNGGIALDTAIRVSVARCARVSYKSFETGRVSQIKEDMDLFQRLVGSQPIHASPAEHQAKPDTQYVPPEGTYKGAPSHVWHNPHEHGNLVGWRQFRKMIPRENCAPIPMEYL